MNSAEKEKVKFSSKTFFIVDEKTKYCCPFQFTDSCWALQREQAGHEILPTKGPAMQTAEQLGLLEHVLMLQPMQLVD